MILTAILNTMLAAGMIVMVITPLVWAILTQHRDHPRLAATDGATGLAPQASERPRTARAHYKPAVDGV
jgi:hypothetical protein